MELPLSSDWTRWPREASPTFRFDPGPHDYWLEGARLWSPSSMLEQVRYIDRRGFNEVSRVRGTRAHAVTHYVDDGGADSASVSDELLGLANGYARFKQVWNFRPRLREVPIYHPQLRYGVTPDGEGWVDDPDSGEKNIPAIVELKTGLVKWWVAFQTAFQEMAIGAWDIAPTKRRRYGVQLLPDDFKVTRFTDVNDAMVARCILVACQRFGAPPENVTPETRLSEVVELLNKIGG